VKFLIDECLSFELVKLAHDRGTWSSLHVVWRKLAGTKDWNLKPIVASRVHTQTAPSVVLRLAPASSNDAAQRRRHTATSQPLNSSSPEKTITLAKKVRVARMDRRSVTTGFRRGGNLFPRTDRAEVLAALPTAFGLIRRAHQDAADTDLLY
jgi:hypothetical protein